VIKREGEGNEGAVTGYQNNIVLISMPWMAFGKNFLRQLSHISDLIETLTYICSSVVVGLEQACQIFLTQLTETRENIPNYYNKTKWPKIYQMTVNIPNDHKIYQHFPSWGPPKFYPKLGFLVWKQTIWQPWIGRLKAMESFCLYLHGHGCVTIRDSLIAK
jgi:hypothetical protein